MRDERFRGLDDERFQAYLLFISNNDEIKCNLERPDESLTDIDFMVNKTFACGL